MFSERNEKGRTRANMRYVVCMIWIGDMCYIFAMNKYNVNDVGFGKENIFVFLLFAIVICGLRFPQNFQTIAFEDSYFKSNKLSYLVQTQH